MKRSRTTNVVLWILQVALAALFVFAGTVKLGMPARELVRQTGLPAPFMQFIGICEVPGGLGLLLPGLVRVHRELTPIAASGLMPIMVGAVVLSVLRISLGAAVFPLVVGVLLLVVARGRRGWVLSMS